MRRILGSSFALVLAAALVSAAHGGEARSFGKPLTDLEPTPLGDVLADPKDGATVCLEGTVAAVCRKKGCWLELKQAERSVHVTFEGYSFFVPRDSAGKSVRLEGKVSVKRPDAGQVEHVRREGAGESAAARVSIVATGVELR